MRFLLTLILVAVVAGGGFAAGVAWSQRSDPGAPPVQQTQPAPKPQPQQPEPQEPVIID